MARFFCFIVKHDLSHKTKVDLLVPLFTIMMN